MKIAVIGAGNVGGELGGLWAAKGHDVVFGVRNPDDPKAQALLTLGPKVRVDAVKDAAHFADVVVLAVPWHAADDAVKSAGDISGKILIDCTNPLENDLSGLTIGTKTSAGEEVAKMARGARVVKAFNTIGAQNFGDPKFGSEVASMFICGDDDKAKAVVSGLAAELEFDVVDCGPITSSRMLEEVAMLWIHLAVKQGLGPTGHAFKLLRR